MNLPRGDLVGIHMMCGLFHECLQPHNIRLEVAVPNANALKLTRSDQTAIQTLGRKVLTIGGFALIQ